MGQTAFTRAQDQWFDLLHNVNTAGEVEVDTPLGWDYGCTTAGLLRSLLSRVSIRHAEYTFIDYGSGKGKPLLVASRMPFRAVIGVECSKSLIEIAADNLGRYRGARRLASNIELRLGDAADLPVPDGPLVLYFFNPFREPVMRRVIENVRASFECDPRPVEIVYINPQERHVIEEWPRALLTDASALHAIYSVRQ